VSHSKNSRDEQASTYFVEDRANKEELARLQVLDQMITGGMGGVLPEQPEPERFQRVLDVGCGTGGWLIAAAKRYPGMSRLVGVDISNKIVEYARAQAAAQQVSDRVEFHVMDALHTLAFPDASFDLINQRFGHSYLRTWDWPGLLQRYLRVCKPGGVIRITEANWVVETNSPALTQLNLLFLQGFYQAGRYFTPDGDGLINELAGLLHKQGVKDIQTRSYLLESRAGTLEGQLFYEDKKLVYHTMLPFLRRWTRVPDNYEQLYQQMLTELQQPDFVGKVLLLTAWGNAPE
jgi:ubiquinone/menaquinone biosynthesis C-methylase UbiE